MSDTNEVVDDACKIVDDAYEVVDDAFWRNHTKHRLKRFRQPLYGSTEFVILLMPVFLGLITILNFIPDWVGS